MGIMLSGCSFSVFNSKAWFEVGFSRVARSLCLKTPLHAEGSGERCCGPPGASSDCSPIAEQLSLIGRPAAKMFPNKGLCLPLRHRVPGGVREGGQGLGRCNLALAHRDGGEERVDQLCSFHLGTK